MRLPLRIRKIAPRLLDRRGSVAVIMALLMPMLVIMVGFSVDYAYAVDIQHRLNAAADTGVLAALSPTTANESGSYATAYGSGNSSGNPMWDLATNTFAANTQSFPVTTVTKTVTVAKGTSGSLTSYTATISWTASVPTWFSGLIGIYNVPIAGVSTATVTPALYQDFYMMIDLSGSMDFASTTSEQARLQAVNQDDISTYPYGCQFACHFAGYTGFTLSRNGGKATNPQVTSCPQPGTATCIQLRVDAIGSALQILLQDATSTATLTNQYRVGLYPFVQYLDKYYPLTYTLNGSTTNSSTINYASVNIATLSDNGGTGTVNSVLGSGGTHFENAMPSMLTAVQAYGIGTGATVANRQPWVFLITDGMENTQTYTVAGNFQGGSNPSAFNSSLCTALKTAGVKVAVMLITYPTLSPEDPGFSGDENGIANTQIPDLPAAAQACATTGFYWQATTYSDIQNDMQAMFAAATNNPRLTQ